MHTYPLMRHLTEMYNFSRKHAMLGIRVAKGVDTIDTLKEVGLWTRRGERYHYTFDQEDIVQIQEVATCANPFI